MCKCFPGLRCTRLHHTRSRTPHFNFLLRLLTCLPRHLRSRLVLGMHRFFLQTSSFTVTLYRPSSIHSWHAPLCRPIALVDKHLPCVVKHNKPLNNLVNTYYVIKCTDQNCFCQVLLRNFLVRGLFSVSLRMYNKKHQRLPCIIYTY